MMPKKYQDVGYIQILFLSLWKLDFSSCYFFIGIQRKKNQVGKKKTKEKNLHLLLLRDDSGHLPALRLAQLFLHCYFTQFKS